ncbi:hypothetical protein L332_03330 [Agrococcus pavilionensis RW1]|uniref:HTH cro/C1-type domain-containing protein n=1 Tax=Agrococcus pavilionensis RW1 TaxID=1330458 RepID=U1LNE7_9MICO|nr:helix-turn-helix transcriptional regulator [Agrococcus pavilionensis]ERG63487.1 hypothetical protein L332_03330 [Agrococcus pavilionensis RW1]
MSTQRQEQDEPLDVLVGQRVHQLMWSRRISQTDFAPRLGFQQSSLSKKLRGTRGWSLDETAAAARALGTTVAFLIGETDDPAPRGRQEGDGMEPAG